MKILRRIQSGHRATPIRQRTTRRKLPTVEGMEPRIVLSGTSWTAIGPAPITGDKADATAAANYAVSGRVTSIATDPDPNDTPGNIAYIGTAGGGVWKGTNIDTTSPTWTPLTDNLATQIDDPLVTLNVGAVATAWDAQTQSTIIYAGLGEANSVSTTMDPHNADSQFYGAGIILSRDGGQTWSLLGGPGSSNLFYRSAISKIVVDPTNPQDVYAAVATAKNGITGNEGIWASTDWGNTWTNTTQDAIPGSDQDMFSDLVMPEPSNPQFLVAAIGEPLGSVDNGVYETTDGGTTWTELTNLPNGQGVGRITLAASLGFQSGTNSPTQYELYAAFMADDLTQHATITNVSGTSTVTVDYTGLQGVHSFIPGQDVTISTPGGYDQTFTLTNADATSLEFDADGQALPSAGATIQAPFGTLYQLGYVTISGTAAPSGQLNPDALQPWNVIPNFDLPSGTAATQGGIVYDYVAGEGYQGYYDTSLAVDPQAHDRIYAGGQDHFLSIGAATSGQPTVDELTDPDQDKNLGTPIHVDHHAVAIVEDSTSATGPYTVLDGSDGGVFAYNPGATPRWTDLNTNLQISQFYSIQANPTDSAQILGGVQDNGSIYTTDSDSSLTWSDYTLGRNPRSKEYTDDGPTFTGGDGGNVFVSQDGGTAYVINTGNLEVSSNPFGPDPTFTFAGGTSTDSNKNLPDSSLGLFPDEEYLMSPSNPQTLWFGTQDLYMTTDAGADWDEIGGPAATGSTGWVPLYTKVQNGFVVDATVVDSIAAPASSSDANMLYVGVRGGHFLFTTNLPTSQTIGSAAVQWTESDPIPITSQNQSALADLKFSDIQVDPDNPDIVYVTVANFADFPGVAQVWMGQYSPSTNAMAWTDISGNLPNVPAWSIQVQPPTVSGSAPILYVGTDIGVFFSTDRGGTWSSYGTGLPNAQARSLSLYMNPSDPSQDELLVGTFGRGAYSVAAAVAPSPSPTPTPTPPPTPTPTPTPPPTPTPTPIPTPSLVRVRHRAARPNGPRAHAGFQLLFDMPLNVAAADSMHSYRITQPGRSRPRTVVVRSARYDATSHMVTLKLGRTRPRRPLTLTIAGLVWAGVPTTTITTTL